MKSKLQVTHRFIGMSFINRFGNPTVHIISTKWLEVLMHTEVFCFALQFIHTQTHTHEHRHRHNAALFYFVVTHKELYIGSHCRGDGC